MSDRLIPDEHLRRMVEAAVQRIPTAIPNASIHRCGECGGIWLHVADTQHSLTCIVGAYALQLQGEWESRVAAARLRAQEQGS